MSNVSGRSCKKTIELNGLDARPHCVFTATNRDVCLNHLYASAALDATTLL
jgi:hypothetical protein